MHVLALDYALDLVLCSLHTVSAGYICRLHRISGPFACMFSHWFLIIIARGSYICCLPFPWRENSEEAGCEFTDGWWCWDLSFRVIPPQAKIFVSFLVCINMNCLLCSHYWQPQDEDFDAGIGREKGKHFRVQCIAEWVPGGLRKQPGFKEVLPSQWALICHSEQFLSFSPMRSLNSSHKLSTCVDTVQLLILQKRKVQHS